MSANPKPASIAGALRRLALVATLPLIALIAILAYAAYREARIDAQVRMLSQAEQLAEEVASFMYQTERALNGVAKRPAVQRLDPAHCDPGLRDLVLIQPSYVNVGVIDRNGWVICASTPPSGGPRSISVATADAFKAVMTGQPFALGPVHQGPLSGRWIVPALAPVHGPNGDILGAVGATIDLLGWWQHRGRGRLDNEIVLGALEKGGRIVLRTPEAEEWVGRDASQQALTAEMSRLGHGTFRATGAQGFERIWAVAPIARTNWIAYAGIRSEAVFENPRQHAVLAFALIVLVLLATGWAVLRTGRKLARPVEDLSATAKRIAEGETGLRAIASGPSELQTVARQFNRVLDARDAGEARLRDFAGLSGDWFWETDAEFRYAWFSGNLKEEVGREPAFYLGRTLMEVAQAAGEDISLEPWKSHLETLARHEPFRNFISRRVTEFGEFWLNISGKPMIGPDGGFLGYRAATTNITRHVLADREARTALAQSEARFRALVESAPEAIAVRDAEILLYVNPAAVRLIGARSKEDLVGRPFLDLVHPEDRAAVTARSVGMSNPGNLLPIESRLIRFDGTTIDVSAEASRITYEGQPAIFISMRNVTERNLAAKALQLQARRFDQVLSNLQGGILLVGTDGKVEYANSTYCEYFRLGRLPDDLIGTRATELLRAAIQAYADPQSAMARAREVIANGLTILNEEVVLKDARVAVRDSVAIKVDGKGHGRLWFYRDITDTLRLHEAARESRDRYQAVIDASMDAIVSVDGDNRIIVFNSAAEKMFMIAAAEVVGKSLERFIPVHHRAGHSAHMRQFARSGVTARKMGEFSHISAVRSDGTVFPIAASISHVTSAAGDVLTATLRDITLQEKAEAALRDSEERYRTIVEWSPIPVRIHRADVVIYANPAAVRLFGATSVDELVGKSIFDQLHPDSLAFARERIARTSDANFDALPAVLKYVRKDGKVIHVEVQGRTISHDGQPAVLASMHDITARSEADETRVSLEAQLRESQKMAAIGTLAGGIAHDFNNILATILGNVELAREDAGARAGVQESLEEIRKAGARARDLVQQILSFSRRRPVERKRIDLAGVVGEAARLLRTTLPSRVGIEVTCVPGTPAVLADATQMEQVLLNLATNAMQAIGDASGVITIRLDSVRDGTSEKVRLRVSDNGPGMDAAIRERIFEPFFATKAVNEGTGLGLSVVHGIVHAHEGSIEVESAPSRGATFTILLEAASGEAGPARDVAASGGTTPGDVGLGRRILYVDDDRALVSLFKRLLERRGYRVSAHVDQHEALAALRADPAAFDLVLTDYNMPGLSGLDVAREALAIRADLPVAIASGFVDESLRAQATAAGVREIVFKATEVDEYCAAVQRLLVSSEEGAR